MGTHSELLEHCEVYQQIAASQLSESELNVGKTGKAGKAGKGPDGEESAEHEGNTERNAEADGKEAVSHA